MPKTIGNPLSWTMGALGSAARYSAVITAPAGADPRVRPETRILMLEDLRHALRKGWDDLAAMRSDVMFACLLYPLMGAVLLGLATQGNLTHLLFPVLRSPRFPRIVMLALVNGVIFMAWLLLADAIHTATLGADAPRGLGVFLNEVVTTPAGWAMAVIGTGVGFVLAALVLAVSVVSFPLLLDRDVSLPVAVMTSVQVARENPVVIAAWGLIVAVGLAVGILPVLLGLIVVLPVLGHATWHLYRAAVV